MEYQFESIGPALRWVVLAFLFLFVVAAVAAVAAIASLPGWIARRRQHPQAASVNVCGWFGLPTGVLWIVAMVWAYMERPTGTVKDSQAVSSNNVNRLREQVSQLEAAVSRLEDRTR